MNELLTYLKTFVHSDGEKRKRDDNDDESISEEDIYDPKNWIRPNDSEWIPPWEQLRYKDKNALRDYIMRQETKNYRKGTKFYHGGSAHRFENNLCCYYLSIDKESAESYAMHDHESHRITTNYDEGNEDNNLVVIYELTRDVVLYKVGWWSAMGNSWGISPKMEEKSWKNMEENMDRGFYDYDLREAEYEFNQSLSNLSDINGTWMMNEIMLLPNHYNVLAEIDRYKFEFDK
jgi:hypothetical protein